MKQFSERLKSARKMKGWSFQDMVNHLSISISKQALHKYETGKMFPSGDVLVAIANALGVKPNYLLKESTIHLPQVEFRKKSRLGKKEIEQIKEKVRDFLERYLETEQLLNLDIKFTNPIKGFKITSIDDVEPAAIKLMQCWNLGLDPIPNVIEMLEENAVRVIEIDASAQFDGLSTYVGEIPVVVLSKNFSIERKRFTALHELGHLVLNIGSEVDKEKLCHAFAGAMLLPADALEKRVGDKRSNIARGELVSLKEEFGISLQAIMKRAELKGIIDKNKAQQFWRSMSSNKKEKGLGQYCGQERSFRFEHLVFRLAAEEIVSLSKASNLAGMKLAEFRDKLDAIN